MTTKETTGEKLISSIRRTKAGGATAASEQAPAKPAPRRRPTKAKPKPAAPKTQPEIGRDPYQSAGRVWPD